MSTDDFSSKLDEALGLDESSSEAYQPSLVPLRRIVEAIEGRMNQGLPEKRIHLDVMPGFQAHLGQQFKVVLRIPTKQFQDSLFRVYLPSDDGPVNLDLYGDEPVACADDEELENRILEFLAKIKGRMGQYRQYAKD